MKGDHHVSEHMQLELTPLCYLVSSECMFCFVFSCLLGHSLHEGTHEVKGRVEGRRQ